MSELIFAFIIILGAVTIMIPFAWMICSALKTNAEFYDTALFPKTPQWSNFTEYFTSEDSNFLLYLFNSVKVTGLSVIGRVLSCSLAGFAFSRLKFPGRDKIFTFSIMTMFLPGVVTMVPIFVIMKKLGLYNSHLALIAPSFFGNAFGVFLLRQFFMSIPKDLDEAAKIDGCNTFTLFYRIYLPLMKPSLITLAILTFQNLWGEILRPIIFLSDKKLYTLAVGIRSITNNQYFPRPELEIAAYTLMIVPVLILYIICQKYFTENIASSGMKG
jgi:ABC-type glycerol-3-phosphate transport system permease component